MTDYSNIDAFKSPPLAASAPISDLGSTVPPPADLIKRLNELTAIMESANRGKKILDDGGGADAGFAAAMETTGLGITVGAKTVKPSVFFEAMNKLLATMSAAYREAISRLPQLPQGTAHGNLGMVYVDTQREGSCVRCGDCECCIQECECGGDTEWDEDTEEDVETPHNCGEDCDVYIQLDDDNIRYGPDCYYMVVDGEYHKPPRIEIEEE